MMGAYKTHLLESVEKYQEVVGDTVNSSVKAPFILTLLATVSRGFTGPALK